MINFNNRFFKCIPHFILLLGLNCFSQNSKIKWGLYGKKTTEELRATFPFNESKKVLLIAFLSPNTIIVDEEDNRLEIDSLNLTKWKFNVH